MYKSCQFSIYLLSCYASGNTNEKSEFNGVKGRADDAKKIQPNRIYLLHRFDLSVLFSLIFNILFFYSHTNKQGKILNYALHRRGIHVISR